MRHYLLTLILFGLTVITTVVSVVISLPSTTPDNLTFLNVLAFGLLITGTGLLIDLYRLYVWSLQADDHKTFWKVIAGLFVIFVIYGVYYRLST